MYTVYKSVTTIGGQGIIIYMLTNPSLVCPFKRISGLQSVPSIIIIIIVINNSY